MAEADAMAERGRPLELRLNALAEKAAASLQRAGLPADGKRANHAVPEIRVLNDIETVAAGITKQLVTPSSSWRRSARRPGPSRSDGSDVPSARP